MTGGTHVFRVTLVGLLLAISSPVYAQQDAVYSGPRQLSRNNNNAIVCICGFMDITEIVSVMPDGSGPRRLAGRGFQWASKDRRTGSVYLTTASDLFKLPLDATSAPQRVDQFDQINMMTFDISPTGQEISYVDFPTFGFGLQQPQGGLWVANLARPAPHLLMRGIALTPRWAPDGSRIVFSTGEQIKIASVEGGSVSTVSNSKGVGPDSLDEDRTIVFNDGGQIKVTDLETGMSSVIVDTGYPNSGPVVSPDGRYVAYSAIRREGHRDIFVWDREMNWKRWSFQATKTATS